MRGTFPYTNFSWVCPLTTGTLHFWCPGPTNSNTFISGMPPTAPSLVYYASSGQNSLEIRPKNASAIDKPPWLPISVLFNAVVACSNVLWRDLVSKWLNRGRPLPGQFPAPCMEPAPQLQWGELFASTANAVLPVSSSSQPASRLEVPHI
jgi:hypothetical protein